MIPAALLPPVQAPPHDAGALILTSTNSWGRAKLDGLHFAARTKRLSLDAAAAAQRTLTEDNGSFGGLVAPTNVALAPGGDIFLLDRKNARLKRFDSCECRFETIPCFGAEKGTATQMRNPSGIGICDGSLFICDTGLDAAQESCAEPKAAEKAQRENHRLIVLSLRGFVPRGYWRPPRSAYEGTAPKLTVNPWKPFDVDFDAQGRVYVSDPANNCIHRFSARGIWLGRIADLGPVTHLAIDCKDRLYAREENSARIKVIELNTGAVREIEADAMEQSGARAATSSPGRAANRPEARGVRPEDLAHFFPCLPFGVARGDRIHLGDLCAPRAKTAPKCADETNHDGWERGVFDLNGDAVKFRQAEAAARLLKNGTLVTAALDSGIYHCVWHRVLLIGEIPEGTSIEVESFTSEIELSPPEIDDIFQQRQLTTRVSARPSANRLWDGLIRSQPGRHLWLRLGFAGNGQATPTVERIEIEFPRVTLRRYLPAVFGEEPVSTDFTDRFLSLFDTTLRSVETTLDNLARYFDPASTPASRRGGKIDFFSWLASWVGIAFDRQWPEERRRRFLKQAGKLFPLRGTRKGLWLQLLIYLGMEPRQVCCENDRPRLRWTPPLQNCAPVVTRPCFWQPPPLILEHFQLRRWLFLGLGRLHDQAVLWGRGIVNRSQLGDQHAQVGQTQLIMRQDPLHDPFHVYAHQFSIFVPAWVGKDDRERKGLENLLKSDSPAHAKWTIHYVEPRFRIGFQSMIGLDAVVGRYPLGVRMQEARLGQGTVLGPAPDESGTVAFRVGKVSRIGSSTQLT